MARPPARELTERELEVMHVFWNRGESTVADVRDVLAADGLDRAYTTVATLVRILADKRFLIQTNDERPFSYQPARSYEEVSRKLLGRDDRPGLPRLARAVAGAPDGADETDGEGAVLAGRGPAAAAGETTMNALGMMLVGSIAHATLFAIAGIAAYLALRRWGPAAGSLAAWPSLAVMAMVSIVALSPWPRWWTFGAVDPPSAAVGVGEAASSPAGAGPTEPDPASPARPAASSSGIRVATDRPALDARPAARRAAKSRRRAGGEGMELARMARGRLPRQPRAGRGPTGTRSPRGRMAAGAEPADRRPRARGVDRDPRRRAGLHASRRAARGVRADDPGHDRLAASGRAAAVRLAGLGRRRAARRPGTRAGARPSRRLPRRAGCAARAGPALLSSPGALAGGPAPAGAGAGGRRLGRPALGRPVVVSGDAGADGPAPRRPHRSPGRPGPFFRLMAPLFGGSRC